MSSLLRVLGWGLLCILGVCTLIVVASLLGSEWAYNILLGLDQWANTWSGGDPDETVSSRLGKWLKAGRITFWDDVRYVTASVVCVVLDIFEQDHCILSVDQGVGGKAVVR